MVNVCRKISGTAQVLCGIFTFQRKDIRKPVFPFPPFLCESSLPSHLQLQFPPYEIQLKLALVQTNTFKHNFIHSVISPFKLTMHFYCLIIGPSIVPWVLFVLNNCIVCCLLFSFILSTVSTCLSSFFYN